MKSGVYQKKPVASIYFGIARIYIYGTGQITLAQRVREGRWGLYSIVSFR